MIVVDTHVHASPYWFEPIELLLYQMNLNRVEKATLVQFEGERENEYLLECIRRFPGRFSAVVGIDHQKPDAADTLRKLVQQGAEGLRLKPGVRSPDKDPFHIWRTCNEMKLPVSCNGRENDFSDDELQRLVQTLPDAPFIVEHLGNVDRDERPPYDNFKNVLAFAKFPNAYIKLGGLSEICKRPNPFKHPFYTVNGVPPFIKMAYDAFGPRRMMWGSNYPPVSMSEGYANALHYLVEHISSFCNESDKEWIMGNTALSLYRFGGAG